MKIRFDCDFVQAQILPQEQSGKVGENSAACQYSFHVVKTGHWKPETVHKENELGPAGSPVSGSGFRVLGLAS